MSERNVPNVIPLIDERQRDRRQPPVMAVTERDAARPVLDALKRPLHDLRISVTDRCNFRCGYCMPRAIYRDHRFLPHDELLSFEEITRTARVFLGLGVRKLRLTGGEPLMRKNLDRLVAMLAELRTVDGEPPELTLTTNGSLLARQARALKDAGLRRVTVSLDALDDATFRRMNDADFPVADVLAGIEAAQAVGLAPLKVNMVVQRSVNAQQILPMARHFRGTGIELRFIEFMDVGSTNGWRLDDVLPSAEIVERIHAEHPLLPVAEPRIGETAQRFCYADGSGSIGLVSSVTKAFCGDCNRARLSTDGRLYLCLFASQGYDLRTLLRDGADDATLARAIAGTWAQRADRYSQLRAQAAHPVERKIEMSFIGG
jgi:cyclic pyranopterin phosphate synthase